MHAIGKLTADAMKSGRLLLVAGNGGSAADSQHLVAEFVSRLTIDRPALRAIALTTDTSILTAIGNDYSYDYVFARQIEALGSEGDVFLAISTSGNSKNLISALTEAKGRGIHTIAFTGNNGGKMRELADHNIIIPSSITMTSRSRTSPSSTSTACWSSATTSARTSTPPPVNSQSNPRTKAGVAHSSQLHRDEWERDC